MCSLRYLQNISFYFACDVIHPAFKPYTNSAGCVFFSVGGGVGSGVGASPNARTHTSFVYSTLRQYLGGLLPKLRLKLKGGCIF